MELVTEEEVHVVCIAKGIEHYVFLYTKPNRREVLHRLGQWASNPDLSFTWWDAARLGAEVRKSR